RGRCGRSFEFSVLAVELFRSLEPPGSATVCENVAFEVLCDSVVAIGKDQPLALSPEDVCGVVEALVVEELEGFEGVSGPAPAVLPGLDAGHFSVHGSSSQQILDCRDKALGHAGEAGAGEVLGVSVVCAVQGTRQVLFQFFFAHAITLLRRVSGCQCVTIVYL